MRVAQERRLLYLTFAIIALIVATLFGGGFYVVHSVNKSASQLTNAHSLIDRANAESAQNPVDALQQLSQAQNALLSVQRPLLVGDQSTQYDTLQGSLRNALQKAMAAYNKQELITQLPCTITQSVSITASVQ